MKRRTWVAALAAAPWLLSGCAGPQASALVGAGGTGRPGSLPRAARLSRVPFYPQRDWECGPAALAMALGAAGQSVGPDELVPEVWIPARRGALQPEMLAAARRRAALAVPLEPRLEALLASVADGLPVIVFQNLGLEMSPVWHYAVLIGYDLDSGSVVIHTGAEEASIQSIHPFERTWVRGGSWAMTVSAPDRLPAGASEQTLVIAMAALERLQPGAAHTGWKVILRRWPSNRAALLGLGNAAWASGDAGAAETAWREAVRRHPDLADAWNNLAVALAARGDREAAVQAVDRAVAIGGPRLGDYRMLQQSLSR